MFVNSFKLKLGGFTLNKSLIIVAEYIVIFSTRVMGIVALLMRTPWWSRRLKANWMRPVTMGSAHSSRHLDGLGSDAVRSRYVSVMHFLSHESLLHRMSISNALFKISRAKSSMWSRWSGSDFINERIKLNVNGFKRSGRLRSSFPFLELETNKIKIIFVKLKDSVLPSAVLLGLSNRLCAQS